MDKFYWDLVRCQDFDFEAISESWLAEQCGLRTVHYLWLYGGINSGKTW